MDATPRAETVGPPVGAGARLHRTLAVVGVVARHGLIHASRRPGPAPAARRARRLRRVLEDLGATAVKLGQIASTRPDVLGPEYLAGQAHAAVHRDGTPVVVKVRRPGVVAQVAVDLDVLGDLRVGDLLPEVMGTMRRNHLRLPVDLALLAETFVMSEGLAARLDPEFRMAPAVLAHLA
ncbi:MAG: AarF/UbiB family protein, partial [Actinomycetota bacterium]